MSDPEATIIINGVMLTETQSMAVRVYVASGLMELQDPDALGTDEHGRRMVEGYRRALSEVQDLIFRGDRRAP